MKIAHVINSLNRGGAESHLLELVTAQADSGIIVDVIVIGNDSPNIFSIKSELSKVSRDIYRLKGPRMFNLFSYIKLQKIIKKNSYDVIHSHQPRSDYMIYLIKKLIFPKNNFKWIVSIHGKYDSYLDDNHKKIFKLYFFKKLVKSWNLADSVIVISNEVEAWLENHTKEINPHVINYWISSKDHKSVDLSSSINIGFLGRLNKNKGIEDLIDSLNGLNLDLNLKIGGFGSDDYVNFLKEKINLKLSKNTSFLGYVEDQSKFFEGIDLFVFPSYSEGLGLVLLEAMSYQKICITRNVEPMNQFINDENGYLFNNNDELKNCITQASEDLKNKEIYTKKIENTKKVIELYDISNVFPKILEVYNL
jgi:glycosyltransferase involved in cell wall biosynthesis